MPCGCKKGHGISLHGAGVRKRKKGGMAISGAGYRKRRKQRRKRTKRARGGGLAMNAMMFGPVSAALGAVAGRIYKPKSRFAQGILNAGRRAAGRKGSGGRFLSGAVWHGYGKGSGMAVHGAGLYGKRLLGRGGSGRRQI